MNKISILLSCVLVYLSLADGSHLQALSLTAISGNERRDTPLVLSYVTEEEPFSLIISDTTNLMRRMISETGDEVIVNDRMLLISYGNGTYQNLSLSCLPFELYDQVGLDPSIVMIITCLGDSTVYVLNNHTNGYSVSERISPPNSEQSSSAAIVIRDDQSTAMYIGPSNILFYYKLGLNGIQVPFNPVSTVLVACADWRVTSSSDTKVALYCKTSGQVFLATGSDGIIDEVTSSVNNPDSLVHIRNEGMAIETTSTGVNIHRNDFVDLSPITIPSPMVGLVSYAYVNNILCLLFFSSSSIHLLKTSNPLTDEFLELMVTENTPIEFNSSYIFISPPFNSLSYVVEGSGFWTVETIDLVTRQYYPSVTQPWNPLLLDMRVLAITASTTTTSTTSSETSIVESTAITSSTTDSTSGSVTGTMITQTTSTLTPSNKVDSPTVWNVNIVIILAVFAFLFVAGVVIVSLMLIVFYFHSSNSKSDEESIPDGDIGTPGTISNHSSDPQLYRQAQQETIQRQETDFVIIEQEQDSAQGREEQVPPGAGMTLVQIYHNQTTT